MRVAWVSFAPLDKRGATITSAIASVRYRMLIPAASLEGCECKVIHLAAGANRRTLMERFRGTDAVVLGKLFTAEGRHLLDLVAGLRDKGIAVLADYSDDHFSTPGLGDAYRALAGAVDRVVASTPELADVVKQHSATPVSVVTDPVEGERREPSVPSTEPFRLLWFGHPSNLDTLRYGLPQLEGLPVTLTLVTAAGAGAERIGARFVPWTSRAVFDELRQCDAVIIPSNPHDPRKAVKSPNRFTESVWAGRFVLAHPLSAYNALADCGWVGEHIGQGLRWLDAHRDEALAKIRGGQALIAERYSPSVVAAAWKGAIELAIRR